MNNKKLGQTRKAVEKKAVQSMLQHNEGTAWAYIQGFMCEAGFPVSEQEARNIVANSVIEDFQPEAWELLPRPLY